MNAGLTCQNCSTTTQMSPTEARAVGWRHWTGKTQGGTESTVVICARCTGVDTSPAPGWRVGCHTCDWEWTDEYNEGPLSKKDARRMADDHECESDTWVKAPGAELAVSAS